MYCTNTICSKDTRFPATWIVDKLIFTCDNSGLEETEKEPFCAIQAIVLDGTCAFVCGFSSFSSTRNFSGKRCTTTTRPLHSFNQSSQHHSQFGSQTASVGVLQMLRFTTQPNYQQQFNLAGQTRLNTKLKINSFFEAPCCAQVRLFNLAL